MSLLTDLWGKRWALITLFIIGYFLIYFPDRTLGWVVAAIMSYRLLTTVLPGHYFDFILAGYFIIFTRYWYVGLILIAIFFGQKLEGAFKAKEEVRYDFSPGPQQPVEGQGPVTKAQTGGHSDDYATQTETLSGGSIPGPQPVAPLSKGAQQPPPPQGQGQAPQQPPQQQQPAARPPPQQARRPTKPLSP